jgi:DNA repair exonuclease SbcCD ATPase subunit
VSTNWEAVRSGDLDALGAAIFDKMAGQKDDPSSVAQEMADAALALIERCKAEQARRETAERRVHEEVSGRQAAETSLARAQQQAKDADEGAASWMRRADSARHRAEQAESSLSASEARAKELERSADALQRAHANSLAASVKASALAAASEARREEAERDAESAATDYTRLVREHREARDRIAYLEAAVRASEDRRLRVLSDLEAAESRVEALETALVEVRDLRANADLGITALDVLVRIRECAARALSGAGAEEGRHTAASHPGEER